MQIIPSIFIQKGKVVSLYKGEDNNQKKSYPKAARSYAAAFEKQGAKTLLVVDLDGIQLPKLKEIRAHFSGDIWWAGKVRNLEYAHACFEAGASHIVLGRSAKDIHEAAIAEFGADKLIAGLQVKNMDDASDFCEAFGAVGFKKILVKDLNAEGTLFHPNFDLMEKCVYFSDLEVYASGGIAEEDHIKLLQRVDVSGVVIGRALYEHQLSLSSLMQTFGSAQH